MSNSAPALADYTVLQSREIAGAYRAEGETLSMDPRQAKYYLPPYGSGLAPVERAPSDKGDQAEPSVA